MRRHAFRVRTHVLPRGGEASRNIIRARHVLSAQASFVAGSVLLAVGAVIVGRSRASPQSGWLLFKSEVRAILSGEPDHCL